MVFRQVKYHIFWQNSICKIFKGLKFIEYWETKNWQIYILSQEGGTWKLWNMKLMIADTAVGHVESINCKWNWQ